MRTNHMLTMPDTARPKMRPWIFLPLIIAAGLILYVLSHGCVSPQGGLDVPATVEELALTSMDLESLAVVADMQGKFGTADALRDASVALDKAAEALEGGGAGDAWATLDYALKDLAAVAAANEDGDLALGVAAAQIVVRRVKAALPEPLPSK